MNDTDLDWKFIAAVIRDKDISPALDSGVTDKHVRGHAKGVWKFIVDYVDKYNDFPTDGVLDDHFDEIKLAVVQESVEYFIDRLLDRELTDRIKELSGKIATPLKRGTPRVAHEYIESYLMGTESTGVLITEKDVPDCSDMIKKRYEDAKNGVIGIPTPWEVMNEWTRGWWPGDVSFVVARSGIGKSFMVMLLAKAAEDADKNVLVVSCEMSIDDLATRYFSIDTKIPYGMIRKGRLGIFEEEKYFSKLEELKHSDNGIRLVDASGGIQSKDLNRLISRHATNRDLIIIDSVYRVKANERVRDRFDGMAHVADDLKTYAQRYKIPIVATTQLNRAAAGKKAPGAEDMAMSDVLLWNASNVFAMYRDEELQGKGLMKVKPLKTRESDRGMSDLILNWDFSRMNFTECAVDANGEPIQESEIGFESDTF